MKRTKHFLLLLAATALTAIANAQTINGDLNHSGKLEVSDVTHLISNYLTGTSETISGGGDPFTVNNSLVVGTWYKSRNESITFNADDTTDYGDGYTYLFLPYQGRILFYNASGVPVASLHVTYITSDYLVVLPAGSDVPCLYTATQSGEITPTPIPDGTTTYTVNGVSFKMVSVKGGTFKMGAQNSSSDSPNYEADSNYDEAPVHDVTLSDYNIGETEVTQALWVAVMGSNPSNWLGDNLPVEKVSWNDCQTFITKLNKLTGQTFRLPTEAEWEYAARGGSKSQGYKYSGSNTIDDVAWYSSNSDGKTHEVGTKQSNELGLYDMSGNVYEWCQDLYGGYPSQPCTNPTGASSGSLRVRRGGSWDYASRCCRVMFRNLGTTTSTFHYLGFRLAQ